ncbi:ROK family transcriptional regulator [Cellulomonas taurus]|uniref:ROK family transcriptional regulator n=1 Tax=Cellulomonas taurus TaxID=2729175 RepID=UPI00145EB5F9|nr:ROK family transcriptional regulator [Cellulomonas taurus]
MSASAVPRSRTAVLTALRHAGELTQVEIVAATGLTAGTVSTVVGGLIDDGVVRVRDVVRTGRRARAVSLAGPGGPLIGVHCYLDQVRVLLDPGDGRAWSEAIRVLPDGHRAELAATAARELSADLLAAADIDPGRVLRAAVGIPAPVEVRTARVGGAGVRDGWGTVVATPGAFGPWPVDFDNEGNLSALAEARLGAGRGRATVVQVSLSQGVSGGIVHDGELVHGRTGTAGELGHLTIDPHGPVCSCGNRGCLQVYAGSQAIIGLLAASHGRLSVAEVLDLAAQGDPGCRRVLSDVGRHLGTAMASVCTVLDPDVLVVGGALSRAGNLLLDPLREVLAERTAVTSGAVVEVVAGVLGAAAPARGALLLAQDAALAR